VPTLKQKMGYDGIIATRTYKRSVLLIPAKAFGPHAVLLFVLQTQLAECFFEFVDAALRECGLHGCAKTPRSERLRYHMIMALTWPIIITGALSPSRHIDSAASTLPTKSIPSNRLSARATLQDAARREAFADKCKGVEVQSASGHEVYGGQACAVDKMTPQLQASAIVGAGAEKHFAVVFHAKHLLEVLHLDFIAIWFTRTTYHLGKKQIDVTFF
jgi:hypothetical protein